MRKRIGVITLLCAALLCGCDNGAVDDALAVESSQEVAASEEEDETSPLLLWEYEGYVDECVGYTWRDEFTNCDYDGDGKTDRVSRTCDLEEQTAEYTIEFGNGIKLMVPQGWNTGFPHVHGADLDGDRAKEILVTLTYDTSTDPLSFGDMWLFDLDEASNEYKEVELPLTKGENGAKGFNMEYAEPQDGVITVTIKEIDYSMDVEVGEEFISNFWGNSAEMAQLRPVFNAEAKEGDTPSIHCEVEAISRFGGIVEFNLIYEDGEYVIQNVQ